MTLTARRSDTAPSHADTPGSVGSVKTRGTADPADAPAGDGDGSGDTVPAPDEFTVRPAYPVYGFVACGAGLLAVGFGFAASGGDGVAAGWRWLVATAFAVLAAGATRALSARPLLVADSTGMRLRVRREWIGVRWEEIESVTVLPRRHLLDDGRIAVHLTDPGPLLSAMSATARRRTDANRRLTGSSLAVPFGLAAAPSDVAVVAVLGTLAGGRCPVTEQA